MEYIKWNFVFVLQFFSHWGEKVHDKSELLGMSETQSA